MVNIKLRELELIEQREQYDKEQIEFSQELQKANEALIKEKLMVIHGKEPTQERVKEDIDFLDKAKLRGII